MIKTIIIKVIIGAIIVFIGLGPMKFLKKMFLTNGELSWLWVIINSFILLCFFIFIVTSISSELKPYLKNKTNISSNKPDLQFFVSDNLVDSTYINSSGYIVYESLLTLSMTENSFIEDVFIELNFPVPITKVKVLKNVGIKDFNITSGINESLVLKGNRLNIINKSIIIDATNIKPGSYLRLEITSDFLKKRDVDRKINYKGYYNWLNNDEKTRENIEGEFNPKFKRVGSINTKSIDDFYNKLQTLDPNVGTLLFWTNDSLWWKKNNYIIEFIPLFQKENFKLHVFRDSDNVFKCLIKTATSKEAILSFRDFSSFPESLHHPDHLVIIMWDGSNRKLYIDNELVDEIE